jgi:hypothetical protein
MRTAIWNVDGGKALASGIAERYTVKRHLLLSLLATLS